MRQRINFIDALQKQTHFMPAFIANRLKETPQQTHVRIDTSHTSALDASSPGQIQCCAVGRGRALMEESYSVSSKIVSCRGRFGTACRGTNFSNQAETSHAKKARLRSHSPRLRQRQEIKLRGKRGFFTCGQDNFSPGGDPPHLFKLRVQHAASSTCTVSTPGITSRMPLISIYYPWRRPACPASVLVMLRSLLDNLSEIQRRR